MPKAFLSYSSSDLDVATRIARELPSAGIEVFFAPEAIHGGEFYANRIVPAIRECEILIVLCTNASVGTCQREGSEHVLREIQLAVDMKKKILPLLSDKREWTDMADGHLYLLTSVQYIPVHSEIMLSDFRTIAHLIHTAAQKKEPPPLIDLNQAIEDALRAGNWRLARDLLPIVKTREHKMLEIVIDMQRNTLHQIRKIDADQLVSRLREFSGSPNEQEARYLLGILSHFFYKAHAIHDPTGGLAVLKQGCQQDVSGRFRLMTDWITASGANFNLIWHRE